MNHPTGKTGGVVHRTNTKHSQFTIHNYQLSIYNYQFTIYNYQFTIIN